jgi:hemolysin III
MPESVTTPAGDHAKFSPSLFVFTVVTTLALLLLALRLIAPGVWQAQLDAPLWATLVAFLAMTMFNCFVEFFFHRYVLHKPAVPLLSYFYRQHTLHHSLTRIARKKTPGGRDIPYVENRFPMTEPEQDEASFFPWYSLAIFSVLITPLLILLHWAVPGFPWFLGGLGALATSLTLYELLHAVEHWPFEKWAPLIEHPHWGWFWRTAYSFHLRHHAVIDCNEAISGFFGLPVADWVFGTCVMPKTLYASGQEWTPEEFKSPRPYAFTRFCDRLADRMVNARRSQARRTPDATVDSAPHPHFTPGEELAHALTHGLGLVASLVGLVLLVIFASMRGDAYQIVSFAVFGLTLLLLYSASTFYHSAKAPKLKRLLHKLDHAAIFLLIAGTYTPFMLVSLRGPWGWTMLGIVWGLCTAGAVFQLFLAGRFRVATTVAYIFLGWLVLVAAKPLLATVPAGGLWLLLAGGLCYTVGTIFYLWTRLRYGHAVWHTFVLGGSTCHFLAVFLFLLPSASVP